MNTYLKLFTLLIGIITTTSHAQPTEWEYFKYLPQDSIIPTKCEQSHNKLSSYFFKNRAVENCNFINTLFEDLANSKHEMTGKVFALMLLYRPIEEKVKIILQNEPEKTQWKELRNIFIAAETICNESDSK